MDQSIWGTPALDAAFEAGDAPKKVDIPNDSGRYIKMRTLSNHHSDALTISELNLVGCIDDGSTSIERVPVGSINAYPIPAKNTLTVDLPRFGGEHQWRYQIVGINGQVLKNNVLDGGLQTYTFDVSKYVAGVYFIVLKNQNGKTFRVKFVVN